MAMINAASVHALYSTTPPPPLHPTRPSLEFSFTFRSVTPNAAELVVLTSDLGLGFRSSSPLWSFVSAH